MAIYKCKLCGFKSDRKHMRKHLVEHRKNGDIKYSKKELGYGESVKKSKFCEVC